MRRTRQTTVEALSRRARALCVSLQRIEIEDLDSALLDLDQARLHQRGK
jgi:hypothetical protein